MLGLKICIGLLLIILVLMILFSTKSIIYRELFSGILIIVVANFLREIPNKKIQKNEKH
jgi:hypothetical protein